MTLEKNRLIIVLDTNIYISALLFGGVPAEIIELARKKKINLAVSSPILLELARILQIKFHFQRKTILEIISELKRISTVVFPQIKIDRIKEDPPDNRILECAVACHADYIVTGDKKHIRRLHSYQNIPIRLPHEFIKEI